MTLAGPDGPRRGAAMGELGLIEDGAVLVDRGRIAWVGAGNPSGPVDEEIDAEGGLVTPGLIDAHTHLVFAGTRAADYERRAQGLGYAEIAAAGGGIRSTMRAVRAASPEELAAAGERHARWMLAQGTTTLEAKSGYGLSLEAERRLIEATHEVARRTGQRILPTFLGAHAVPPEFDETPDPREAYLERLLTDMLPVIAPQVHAVDMFVEQGYFAAEHAERLAAAARERRLALRLHVDQFGDHGGAALAARLGALTADHLEHTGPEGIAALARSTTLPVLLPGSVEGLGLGRYADARRMIEAGLPVVVATDFNPGTSPIPSLPLAMHLALTQMKMTFAEIWTAVTINAAHALGVGKELGSLEVGKRADLVIWQTPDFREVPLWAGTNLVRRVMLEGRA